MLQRVLFWIGISTITLSGLATAQPFAVVPTTNDGTVPGTTIDYTITATGTAREIFAPGQSDGAIFEWANGFPEFVGTGTQTLTVDFSSPVPLNRIVLGVNSVGIGPFALTVSGGTGSTNDFDISDGLAAVGGSGPCGYDPATGLFTPTGGNQSLMISSSASSAVTLTQLSLTGDNGGDGYTLFFGPTETPVPVELQSFTID